MKRGCLFIITGVFLLSACNTSTEIEVQGYWMRSGLKGGNSAMYMIMHNYSEVNDELIGASSDVAQAVEIHESKLGDDGIMQMIPQEAVSLAADEKVEFKPGGLHVMFVGLKQDLNVGDEIMVVLHFKNHTDISVTVPVKDASEMGGSGMDGRNMP